MHSGSPSNAASPPASAPLTPAAELQRRWRLGDAPQIEAFVTELPVSSPRELAAVARVDLRQRWLCGQRPQAQEYLARFPQIRSQSELVVDLIYAEFLVREELGQQPLVADLQCRFPEYAAELSDQIELHQALDASEAWPQSADDTYKSTRSMAQALGVGGDSWHRLPSLGPDYEILAEIGRGGMGVVYRARQVSLNRLVALKMVRAAETASGELLARFRAEAEAVARLHHPQIVQIYDYGERDGLPYLALELVDGSTLAAKLDGRPWPASQAAALIETLAQAVHFAHQHGVIHRDLKPANILLQADCAKIADFGLAKVFGEGVTSQTQTGTVLGTPCYMAPEQAVGQTQQIGPPTDVYSLGAILYELLTGRPPFRAESALETLRQVVTQEPVSLCRLQPRLPRDLTTICAKCLCKEPRQRYASAGELAADLGRFRADQPIRARPVGPFERGWRWCRRNPVMASLTGSLVVLLLTIATVSSVFSIHLHAQLNKTQLAENAERQAKLAAQLRLFDSYVAEASARHATRRIGQRFSTLETVEKANVVLDEVGRTSERVLLLRNATIAALALPDLRRLRRLDGWPGSGGDIAFTAAADRYVVATTGRLVVYRLSDGQQLLQIEHQGADVVPTISPDGKHVAISDTRGVRIWRIEAASPAIVWEEAGAGYATFSPDNRHVAVSGADRQMHLLDLASGTRVLQLGQGPARSRFAFHQPSQRIAACGTQHVQIISADSGKVLTELPSPPPNALNPSPCWHPAGEYLAVTGYENGVALWHVPSARRDMTYSHLGGKVNSHFSAGGDLLLTQDAWNGNLRLWQTATGRELLSDPIFPHFVSEVTDTGKQLLLALEPAGPALWVLEPAAECAALPRPPSSTLGNAISIDISPDGCLLAVGRELGLELWDLATWQSASLALSHDCFARFAGDGSLFVRCESGVFRWPRSVISVPPPTSGDGAVQPLTIHFGPPEKLFGPTIDYKFAITLPADLLVVQSQLGWQIVHSASPGRQISLGPQGDPRMVSISHDGRWVALGSWQGGATVYETKAGAPLVQLPVGPYADVLFSPDGRWLATSPGGVELWRTADWRPGPKVHARGSNPSGLGLAFSPDSRVLAVGEPIGQTRLVDLETGLDWATLTHPDRGLGARLRFSPDQSQLVILGAGTSATPNIWNLAAIRRELARLNLDWPADVLQPQPGSAPVRQPHMVITFDDGNLPRQQQAIALLRQASTTKAQDLRELFERAIELDPNNALAHNNLAWQLATGPDEVRDAERAVQHARRAVELEGERHSYLNTLGVALYRAGEFAEATETLQRSLRLSSPEDAAYDLIFLALCHGQQGEWSAANDSLARATAAFQDHFPRLTSAARDELTRYFDEARTAGLPR